MKKIYDVSYFIDKFEKIPEDNWIESCFSDGKGRHCAGGHCGARSSSDMGEIEEVVALHKLFEPLGIENKSHYTTPAMITVANINDGNTRKYRQPTPKQRILAALYDIKKLNSGQEAQVCDATNDDQGTEAGPKKEYVVVKVSESIYDQVKELVMS